MHRFSAVSFYPTKGILDNDGLIFLIFQRGCKEAHASKSRLNLIQRSQSIILVHLFTSRPSLDFNLNFFIHGPSYMYLSSADESNKSQTKPAPRPTFAPIEVPTTIPASPASCLKILLTTALPRVKAHSVDAGLCCWTRVLIAKQNIRASRP